MGAYSLVISTVSDCDSILLINTGTATWYYDDDDNPSQRARCPDQPDKGPNQRMARCLGRGAPMTASIAMLSCRWKPSTADTRRSASEDAADRKIGGVFVWIGRPLGGRLSIRILS